RRRLCPLADPELPAVGGGRSLPSKPVVECTKKGHRHPGMLPVEVPRRADTVHELHGEAEAVDIPPEPLDRVV
ncbi:unnamed protein product, partial [Penicillium egyptiacum]